MSTSNARQSSMRNRFGIRAKVNGDENAVKKNSRQSSTSGVARTGHSTISAKATLAAPRTALGEVNLKAIIRNKDKEKSKATSKDKEDIPVTEAALKRSRSSSLAAATGPQRAQNAASRAATSTTRSRAAQPYKPATQVLVPEPAPSPIVEAAETTMDIEEPHNEEVDNSTVNGEREVEEIVAQESDEEEPITEPVANKAPRVWPEVSTDRRLKHQREIDAIRETFENSVDLLDPTMVSEYADEIFEYMEELEEETMPDANYMAGQNEINWSMRQTLVDWLLQVHSKYHMLPETLWIAINIVDRFLTKRVVSLVKLQLVGVTAMFIAAKYEEILAPSVEEFVYMTEGGYSKEEILKGERIVLQTLEFRISQYCSPYSWMRKISKADDYDIQTRTLSKFLTEVTLLDHRFIRVKPSLIAAVGMYSARKMLGGDWNEAFVFHSGCTEEMLAPGHAMLIEKLCEPRFEEQHVFKKYAHKRFLKASLFATEWAHTNAELLTTSNIPTSDGMHQ